MLATVIRHSLCLSLFDTYTSCAIEFGSIIGSDV